MYTFSLFLHLFIIHSRKSQQRQYQTESLSLSAESTFWWLIIYNHTHCLLYTVMNNCTWGTAPWWVLLLVIWASQKNVENTVKIKDKEVSLSAPNESRSCFCQVTNFGTTCCSIHKRFLRFSMTSLQNTSCRSATSVMEGLMWHWPGMTSLPVASMVRTPSGVVRLVPTCLSRSRHATVLLYSVIQQKQTHKVILYTCIKKH